LQFVGVVFDEFFGFLWGFGFCVQAIYGFCSAGADEYGSVFSEPDFCAVDCVDVLAFEFLEEFLEDLGFLFEFDFYAFFFYEVGWEFCYEGGEFFACFRHNFEDECGGHGSVADGLVWSVEDSAVFFASEFGLDLFHFL